LGVRSERAGFSDLVTGSVLAIYYLGFLVGTRHVRRLMVTHGLIRTVAALTVVMALVAAGPAIAESAAWWLVLRFVQGYAISASYVLTETYVNRAVGNTQRGRALGIYMMATMLSYAIGSWLLSVTGADGPTPFLSAGALTALGAVLLVGLPDEPGGTTTASAVALSMRDLVARARVGVAISILVGFVNGAISSIAVYGERADLGDSQTARISAAVGFGPLVVLYPLGALSDRLPRRIVISGAAFCASGLLVVTIGLQRASWPMAFTVMLAGGLTIALYTLTSAEINDHVAAHEMAAASSLGVLLYGVGAMVGPVAATAMMAAAGPDGLLWAVAAGHVLIAATITVIGLQHRASPSSKERVRLPA
jgi:MFS family permease